MSRKRMVAALLLFVALALGVAGYVTFGPGGRTNNAEALASAEVARSHGYRLYHQVGNGPVDFAFTDDAIDRQHSPDGERLALLASNTERDETNVGSEETHGVSSGEEETFVAQQSIGSQPRRIVLASSEEVEDPRSRYVRYPGGGYGGSSGIAGRRNSGSSGAGYGDNGGIANGGGSGSPENGMPQGEGPSEGQQQNLNGGENSAPGSNESEAPGSGQNQTPHGSRDDGDPTGDADQTTPPSVAPPSDTQPPGAPKSENPQEGNEPKTPPYVYYPGGPPETEHPQDKPVSVPEPTTLGLLGFGLAALGITRRKKKQ